MAILEDLETSKCKNGPPNDLFYGFPEEKKFGRWDKNSYIYPCDVLDNNNDGIVDGKIQLDNQSDEENISKDCKISITSPSHFSHNRMSF